MQSPQPLPPWPKNSFQAKATQAGARYRIIWTDVLEPYGTGVSADKCIALFGALSFWWMGEHGSPRMDTSEHVFFVNDQLAVRCLEEIDVDYMAPDVTAALLTAAP